MINPNSMSYRQPVNGWMVGTLIVGASAVVAYAWWISRDAALIERYLPAGVFWLMMIISTLMYCIPIVVALKRSHPQYGPIIVINLLTGWTFFGWVVALAWSVSRIDRSQ